VELLISLCHTASPASRKTVRHFIGAQAISQLIIDLFLFCPVTPHIFLKSDQLLFELIELLFELQSEACEKGR
jgi:hypothetical protein